MNIQKQQLGKYLIERKLADESQINRCLALIKGNEKYAEYKLGDMLIEENYINIEVLAEYLEVPAIDISKLRTQVDATIFDKLDKEVMFKKKFVPYRKDNQGILQVCMVNIQSKNERNEIIQYLAARQVINNPRQVAFYLSSLGMIEAVIDLVSRRHEIAENQLTDEEKELKNVESLPEEERPRYFYDRIISRALKQGASDIHFEPFNEKLVIKYRIDGAFTIKPAYVLPKRQFLQPIFAIIKTKAELNVAEKRLPQGGSINYENQNELLEADLRVSFLNTVRGEKCVIRILPKSNNIKTMSDLGLSTEQKDKLLYLSEKPQGMILVTGPTGSGKTTTLYALLQHINDGTRNIMTAEDPVEMYIEGINQVQVNKSIDFTFDVILREFLRQDPDVLMVGEIRDLETAKMATKASETGHLVFSTLHTNSGIDTINRLVNMDIPVYLLNASLTAVIAQRLVRKLCPYCKLKENLKEKHKLYINEKIAQSPKKINNTFLEEVYYEANPEGCPKCNEGFKGRVAVYEILVFSDKLKNAISSSDHVDVIELTRTAVEDGHELMYVDGLRKAKQGLIPLDELIRIVQ